MTQSLLETTKEEFRRVCEYNPFIMALPDPSAPVTTNCNELTQMIYMMADCKKLVSVLQLHLRVLYDQYAKQCVTIQQLVPNGPRHLLDIPFKLELVKKTTTSAITSEYLRNAITTYMNAFIQNSQHVQQLIQNPQWFQNMGIELSAHVWNHRQKKTTDVLKITRTDIPSKNRRKSLTMTA